MSSATNLPEVSPSAEPADSPREKLVEPTNYLSQPDSSEDSETEDDVLDGDSFESFDSQIEGLMDEPVMAKSSSSLASDRPPEIEELSVSNEANLPIDFEPFVQKLAPSTRKILDEDFHAKFIHIIKPKKETSSTT